jgi:hypothetical protein
MRGALLGIAALAFIAVLGRADSPARADGPPAEYAALYAETEARLDAFEAQVDADWDGSVGDRRFAAGLLTANGNKGAGLLLPQTWDDSMLMLDRLEGLGVRTIKLEVQYPLFTPAFHTYIAANPPPAIPNYTLTAQHYLGTPNSFYNKLVAEVRSRGLGLWIEYGTTVPPG